MVVIIINTCYNGLMKLIYNRKSKDPIYYMGMSYRNGDKTSTKQVARIGKHSELIAQGKTDPLEYAKSYVMAANQKMKGEKTASTVSHEISFEKKAPLDDRNVPESSVQNIGYLFLQCVYHDLDLSSFFREITADKKIEFDPDDINRMLAISQVMSPASKLKSLASLGRYYGAPDIEYQHVMRTMTLMAEHFDEYISHLYKKAARTVSYDSRVCYYDCTNFYFETEVPDEDYVDPVTGEIIRGFRKHGPSKQHQPAPLVQMGLFMDANGLPISMCLTEGNRSEQTTVIDTEKKMIRNFRSKEVIYCADAGLGSYDIREFNNKGNRKFIVTQSVKKLSKQLQEAVFSDTGYRRLSNDSECTIEEMKSFDISDRSNEALYSDKIYKVIEVETPYDCGLKRKKSYANGSSREVKDYATLRQRIIITFDRKSMEYQRWVRKRQVERANRILESIDPATYKKGPNDVTRFIRMKKGADKKCQYCLDEKKIEYEEQYDGFYAVATNLDDDVRDVLEVSSRRWKIEECFRIMKTNFRSRPVYHYTKEHIIAHFMICYTALLVYRILEKKLNDYGKRIGQHYTISEIIETLNRMNIVTDKEYYYIGTSNNSHITNALNIIYPLELDCEYYLPKKLKKILRKYR